MKVIQESINDKVTTFGSYKGHTRNVKGAINQIMRGRKPSNHAFTNVIIGMKKLKPEPIKCLRKRK